MQQRCTVMRVEVAYATPKDQVIISIDVNSPCTVKEAIEKSGILKQFPDIDLQKNTVGIFSKKVSLSHLLRNKDRVEIYRPLLIDPKQARLLRARKKG